MKTRIGKILGIWICMILMVLYPAGSVGAEQTSEKQVIRVGYMDYKGFIDKNRDGTYSGYAVSYLNEIAKYTGWTYQYKFSPWEKLQQDLKEGRIDLICSTQKTPEREEQFDFAEYRFGTESAVVYVNPRTTAIYYNDCQAMDGTRVGMLKDSFQNAQFEEYAKENHFTYEPVYYSTDWAMVKALEHQEVDMMVTGSLAFHQDLKPVAKFGVTSYFPMTTAGNTELLSQLNAALEEIRMENPYFEGELYSRFYATSSSDTEPLFTREDSNFIASQPEIDITLWGGDYPYSTVTEHGQIVGIEADILKLIGQKSGLKIKLHIDEETDDLAYGLKDGSYDLIAGEPRAEKYLEDPKLQLTNAYLNTDIEAVVRSGDDIYSKKTINVAIPDYCDFLGPYLDRTFEKYQIYYQSDMEACLDMLIAGDADMMLEDGNIINYYLQKPKYRDLSVASSFVFNEPLCIIGNQNVDPRLFSVLDKTITSLQVNQISRIVTNWTTARPYVQTLGDILYRYKFTVMMLTVLAILLAIALLALYKKRMAALLAKRDADILRTKAERDALTGMYNKDTFYHKTHEFLVTHAGQQYDLVSLDVERFKVINDLFGMDEGDKLLKYLAAHITAYNHKCGGICCRIHADNFISCIPRTGDERPELYTKLQKAVSQYPLDTIVELRCGVFHIENHQEPVNIMCDHANMASAQVKGNYLEHIAVYNASHREQMLHEQEIINDMHDALTQEQFAVYIQPKCDVRTGQIIGGEALARWIHPKRGMINPGEFIPVFEKNGFIVQLDQYIWEHTCQFLRHCRDMGYPVYPVSVNLSRISLYYVDTVDILTGLIHKYELRPENLELEVTESAYTQDGGRMYKVLEKLQSLGFKILMDDFGSGYSSLNMLKEAPVDILKMDMYFCMGSDCKNRGKRILTSIVEMAKQLEFKVIAEGVETEVQLGILREIGCDYAQGFYFYKPMGLTDYTNLIMNQKNS